MKKLAINLVVLFSIAALHLRICHSQESEALNAHINNEAMAFVENNNLFFSKDHIHFKKDLTSSASIEQIIHEREYDINDILTENQKAEMELLDENLRTHTLVDRRYVLMLTKDGQTSPLWTRWLTFVGVGGINIQTYTMGKLVVCDVVPLSPTLEDFAIFYVLSNAAYVDLVSVNDRGGELIATHRLSKVHNIGGASAYPHLVQQSTSKGRQLLLRQAPRHISSLEDINKGRILGAFSHRDGQLYLHGPDPTMFQLFVNVPTFNRHRFLIKPYGSRQPDLRLTVLKHSNETQQPYLMLAIKTADGENHYTLSSQEVNSERAIWHKSLRIRAGASGELPSLRTLHLIDVLPLPGARHAIFYLENDNVYVDEVAIEGAVPRIMSSKLLETIAPDHDSTDISIDYRYEDSQVVFKFSSKSGELNAESGISLEY